MTANEAIVVIAILYMSAAAMFLVAVRYGLGLAQMDHVWSETQVLLESNYTQVAASQGPDPACPEVLTTTMKQKPCCWPRTTM